MLESLRQPLALSTAASILERLGVMEYPEFRHRSAVSVPLRRLPSIHSLCRLLVSQCHFGILLPLLSGRPPAHTGLRSLLLLLDRPQFKVSKTWAVLGLCYHPRHPSLHLPLPMVLDLELNFHLRRSRTLRFLPVMVPLELYCLPEALLDLSLPMDLSDQRCSDLWMNE